jgi:hypothetical protein
VRAAVDLSAVVVADIGRLHLVNASGRSLCGKPIDPRDLYQRGGFEEWAERRSDRCRHCERLGRVAEREAVG